MNLAKTCIYSLYCTFYMRFLWLFVGLHFYGSIVKDVVLLLVPTESDPTSVIIETIEEGGDEADATKHSEGQGHGLELVLENSTKKTSYTLTKPKMSPSSHSIQCCKCPLRSINLIKTFWLIASWFLHVPWHTLPWQLWEDTWWTLPELQKGRQTRHIVWRNIQYIWLRTWREPRWIHWQHQSFQQYNPSKIRKELRLKQIFMIVLLKILVTTLPREPIVIVRPRR